MKQKFRVEVALLFQDKTWDTVWVDVDVIHSSLAGKKAEEVVRNTCKDTVSHITTVCVQEGK